MYICYYRVFEDERISRHFVRNQLKRIDEATINDRRQSFLGLGGEMDAQRVYLFIASTRRRIRELGCEGEACACITMQYRRSVAERNARLAAVLAALIARVPLTR